MSLRARLQDQDRAPSHTWLLLHRGGQGGGIKRVKDLSGNLYPLPPSFLHSCPSPLSLDLSDTPWACQLPLTGWLPAVLTIWWRQAKHSHPFSFQDSQHKTVRQWRMARPLLAVSLVLTAPSGANGDVRPSGQQQRDGGLVERQGSSATVAPL